MRSLVKLWLALPIFVYFAACAPVKFSAVEAPEEKAIVPVDTTCSGDQCIESYVDERVVDAGLVDIIIVNDNSGSMSTEQRKMGDKFPTFLASLGSLDYRVAMITTDVQSSSPKPNGPNAYNGQGGLQNGRPLKFSTDQNAYLYNPGFSGPTYLDRGTAGKEALFSGTVQRGETIRCEDSGFTQCPSNDERGIYAMNLFLDNHASSIIRPASHVAFMILTDEDERGMSDQRSAQNDSDRGSIALYPLENYDRAATFMSKFRAKYPQRTVSVHPIMVRPGDTGCRDYQSSQAGGRSRGVEGYSYFDLYQQAGGRLGSICDSDYGAQLGDVGSYLQRQKVSMPFKCRPIGDAYTVDVIPQPGFNVDVTADFGSRQMNVNTALPAGTTVRLSYRCNKY